MRWRKQRKLLYKMVSGFLNCTASYTCPPLIITFRCTKIIHGLSASYMKKWIHHHRTIIVISMQFNVDYLMAGQQDLQLLYKGPITIQFTDI